MTRRRTKHYRKPHRRSAKTELSKARSLQASWRKATNRTASLTIAEAKQIVAEPPRCPYCNEVPYYKNISVDHMQPRSREGTDSVENLVFCCKNCNLQKGNLTASEYKALLAFLNEQPMMMKESILLRLRAGGAALRRRRR